VTAAGTNRVTEAFLRARREKRAVIIPYLTAGFPALDATVDLVLAAAEGGADLVEMGLPFSDPLADGPTIQAASQKALENGITHRRALDMAAEIRRHSAVPLIFMGYYNPLLRFGIDAFLREMAAAGVDGLIVPDMPFEESLEVREAARTHGVGLTFLVAPTTPEDRISVLDAVSSEFLYCVSLTGVTGARRELDPGLPVYLSRVAGLTRKPFVVGFGISRPDQVDQVAPPAAGVVIGSALIQAIANAPEGVLARDVVRDFVSAFSKRISKV
jgi:tryptophan synthase alpha chain